jgi:hypothetical protein
LSIDGKLLEFRHATVSLAASPTQLVPRVSLYADFGQQADVDNARVGTGATVRAAALVRPTQHLGLDLLAARRWIDETVDGVSGRLFRGASCAPRRPKSSIPFPVRLIRAVRRRGGTCPVDRPATGCQARRGLLRVDPGSYS